MATKPPDAFLSYTRFNDREGRISAFRGLLEDAVKDVTGEPFKIFQDVEGIGIGEHWPDKLDQMLDEARFFIPIVTQGYFTSRACREELERFLHAEAARGRKDLVLPIYWIESRIWEDPNLRAADPLAAEIYKRQRHDWRQLQFSSSFSTKTVRTALHKLALEIDRARRRPMPEVTAPQTTAAAQASHPEQTAAVPAPPAVAVPRRAEAAATSGAEPYGIDVPLTARWAVETVLSGNRDTLALPDQAVRARRETLRPGTVFRDIDAPWCPEMVVIPPGEFMMGSAENERGRTDREGPQHRVTFTVPFALGRYPVTFEEYDHFCDSTTAGKKSRDQGWGRGRRPVINVSFEDAEVYCAWLSARTGGHQYRLPTEAEWEYACRACTTTPFWTGITISTEQANYDGRHIYSPGRRRLGHHNQTIPIDAFEANPWGLHDMHGNVWEWCADCWNVSYKGAPSDGRAWTSGDCGHRVIRGGSWDNKPEFLRSASRLAKPVGNRNEVVGFRVARAF